MTEDEAVEALRVVLEDAAETGIIDDYARCPGEPTFEVWPIPEDDDTSFQISVRAVP